MAGGILAAACLRAFAGSAEDMLAKSVIEPEPESRIHCLIQVEATDHHITPRGLDINDAGLTLQPLVVILFDLYKNKDGFLNDVTLFGSLWNDWGTKPYGVRPGQWNEIDPAGGVKFKFAKGFQLDVALTGFRSETESYSTCINLDVRLTYHDSFMGAFSVNPYVELFDELSNKATVIYDQNTSSEGYYFVLGIDPTYKFDPFPLVVELPSFVNIVSPNFYQRSNGADGGAGPALITTGIKFSTPLKFMPKSYGAWTLYAGYEYYYLNNTGLIEGNQLLTGKPYQDHNLSRFYGGISVFF